MVDFLIFKSLRYVIISIKLFKEKTGVEINIWKKNLINTMFFSLWNSINFILVEHKIYNTSWVKSPYSCSNYLLQNLINEETLCISLKKNVVAGCVKMRITLKRNEIEKDSFFPLLVIYSVILLVQ